MDHVAAPTFGAGLTKAEVERYSRQCLLPEIGAAGTAKILRATVAVIGAGGLGTTVIPYLAAAGVGRLIIVDDDTVDRSNLHRQIIHTDAAADCDEPKALSAKRFVAALNPTTRVDAFVTRLMPPSSSSAAAPIDSAALTQRDAIVQLLLTSVDVICDCTDNPAARYLLNDIAVRAGIPLVSGAAMRWDGQLTVYNFANRGPTYRCMFPRPPAADAGGGAASCNDVGVFGPVPGMIGTLQANEALKVILTLSSFRGGATSGSNASVNNDRRRDRDEDNIIDSTHDDGGAAVENSTIDDAAGSKFEPPRTVLAGRMLSWNALTMSFRVILMRHRQPDAVRAATEGPLRTIDGAVVGGCATVAEAATAAPGAAASGTASEGGVQSSPAVPPGGGALDATVTPTAAVVAAATETHTDMFRFVHVNAAEVSRLVENNAASDEARGGETPLVIVDVRAEGQVEMCNLTSLYPHVPTADAGGSRVRIHACSLPQLQKLVAAVSTHSSGADSNSCDGAASSGRIHEAIGELLKGLGVAAPPSESAVDLRILAAASSCCKTARVAFVCRRGRASVMATKAMLALQRKLYQQQQASCLTSACDGDALTPPTVPAASSSASGSMTQQLLALEVVNINGGLNAWSREADARFPYY